MNILLFLSTSLPDPRPTEYAIRLATGEWVHEHQFSSMTAAIAYATFVLDLAPSQYEVEAV